MTTLPELLESYEEWLMERVLMYARKSGFTAYTSTLVEAWRLSISGLSASIIEEFTCNSKPPRILVDQDLTKHNAAQFGIEEAKKHRERGISLTSFIGLFKYYRQAYLDLLQEHGEDLISPQESLLFVSRVYDIIEAGICIEWAGGDKEQVVYDLQKRNREMTNEKNKYLTIFESIPNPVFVISASGEIDNLNFAAARFIDSSSISGAHYYKTVARDPGKTAKGLDFSSLLPWLVNELNSFVLQEEKVETVFEKSEVIDDLKLIFRVKLARMLDVSAKFNGVVLILEDITSFKEAQQEVQTLEGFIPICSHCKKVRDDQGYWARVEEYIESRSSAQFSHSICNDCVKRYYSDIVV